MAQPRRKGKSKQKSKKPAVVVETNATKVEETQNAQEQNVTEVKAQPAKKAEEQTKLSPKELKKQEKEQAKKDKQIAKQKADKKRKEADEKAGKIGLKQRFKETGSELKKISWPSFKETMKKTGVVIAVVLFFAVVLIAFDFGLSKLFGLLV